MARLVRSFTFSDQFISDLEALFQRLQVDQELRARLLPGSSLPLSMDSHGLTEANYRVLQEKAGCATLHGLALLNYMVNRPELRAFVTSYVAVEARNNRKATRHDLRRSDFVNRSRVVETLLWRALKDLKEEPAAAIVTAAPTEWENKFKAYLKKDSNAPVESGRSTRRNATKIA